MVADETKVSPGKLTIVVIVLRCACGVILSESGRIVADASPVCECEDKQACRFNCRNTLLALTITIVWLKLGSSRRTLALS